LIDFLYRVFYYLILARVILSFIAINTYDTGSFLSQARKFIYKATEPVLAPLRKVIPPVQAGAGYLDLSPIIALIALWLLRDLLIRLVIILL
jgi:YggT family protein